MNTITIKENIILFSKSFFAEITPFFNTIVEKSDIFLLSIFLLLFGWWVGEILENAIVKIGDRPLMKKLSEKSGFSGLIQKAEIKSPPALVIGQFVKGYIFMLFILSVAKLLEIDAIANFLQSFATYIPNLIVALVIVLFGVQVGETASAIIYSGFRLAKSSAGKILGVVAKGIIITFSILAALVQLKIAEELVQILFIGFVSLIVIAGGLAFGLGGKKTVEEFLEDLRNGRDEE